MNVYIDTLIEQYLNAIRNWDFWLGFVTPLGLYVILKLGNRFVELWNSILQFFGPTVQPGQLPVVQGPSKFTSFMNFFLDMLTLSVVLAIVVIFIYLWVRNVE